MMIQENYYVKYNFNFRVSLLKDNVKIYNKIYDFFL